MPSTVTDRVSGVGGAVSPPAVSTLPPGGASPTNVLERVPGIGSGVGIPIQDIVIRVDDRVELAALPADYIVAFLQEAGREGLFKRTIANLSAFVTNDPQQGVYVASDSDPTGASGAWVRIYDEAIRLSWFGATGDGVTNDSAAIQSWLNYIIANRRAGYVPGGTYLMNTQVTANIGGLTGQDQIKIFGDGMFISRFVPIKTNINGCIKITATDNTCNLIFEDIGFGSKLDTRVTAERDAPNGTALWVTNTSGPGPGGAFGAHDTNSVVVRNCYFGSDGDGAGAFDYTGSWGRCLRIDYMWYPKVEDCFFKGLSNVNTTTYDPKTRVAGINFAAIDMRSCFAPEVKGNTCNGYYDYGLYRFGEATTGNAEQGGFFINNVFAAQRTSILIDHSNATGPTPYHSGFQISDCHINGNDRGIHIVQHAKVQISNCQCFASYNTENSVNLTAGIYLENAADVTITGCGFYEPGYYVSDTECWCGIYVASTFKNGFVASGCQFSAGGVGISYHTSFPGFVFSSIWDGQTTGAWATMKQFVDTTGYLVIDGGPPDTAKGVTRITSGRTDATVSPRFALVSQRTDFAANPTSDMGALDIRSLNSTGVEKIAALLWATWLDNVTGSEDVQVNWGWLDNSVLKSLSISANTKLFNLPSGYNFAVAGVPLSAAVSYLTSSVAGTNAVTAVTSPSFAAYPSDGIVYIKMPVNSAAVTLALNGLAARAVNFGSGAALAGGEFSGTQTCALRILATTFEIVSGV